MRAGRAMREKGWAKENGTGPDAGGKGGEGGLGCLGWAWRREKKRMSMGRLGFGSLGWVEFLVLGWVFFLFSFANLTQTI